MSNRNVRFITRTAILLALTIVFQMMGRYLTPYLGQYNNFVVGPLVNACLVTAAALVGLSGGTIIGIMAPFGAILTGAAIPLPFAPFIAAGNFLIVLGFYLLRKKRAIGILLGALLKFGFLYGSVNVFVQFMNIPAKKSAALIFTFSWPQLVTALVGGAIAVVVIKALNRQLEISPDNFDKGVR